ncbi:hypothetical protein PS627_04240 [Pseudomonas fluorescens]|nr:hypothetical protein PS627_04240 [Pseudomonas fluorescens]VVP79260.1 hypothetical protein PS910_01792 [Pseudomonas fluorescens]
MLGKWTTRNKESEKLGEWLPRYTLNPLVL